MKHRIAFIALLMAMLAGTTVAHHNMSAIYGLQRPRYDDGHTYENRLEKSAHRVARGY
jgi:hypothetical protein